MFIAEAADIDPDDFSWLVFARGTALRTSPQAFNQRHTLVLSQGDLFGVSKTRKGFQIVKADAMHVLFRSIPQSLHDNIMKNSKAYRGVIPSVQRDDGYERARKVKIKTAEKKPLKRTDDYFKQPFVVKETVELDYANYQWRKMLSQVRLASKKSDKTQTILKLGQLVGLRYVEPAKGSYVIYDDDRRVWVSHEMFTEVLQNSKCLPLNLQREGLVDIATGIEVKPKIKRRPPSPDKSLAKRRDPRDGIKALPPILEEEIVPKYDLSELTDEDIAKGATRRLNQATRTKRVVNNIMTKIPDLEQWNEELDPEEVEETEDTDETTDSENVPSGDEGQDVGDDEEASDEDENEEDSEAADSLIPGTFIRVGKREFVIIQADQMERNENLMEYILFEPENEDDDFMLYKLRLPTNYMLSQFEEKAEVLSTKFDEAEVAKIHRKIEFATFKTIPLVK